MRNGAKPGEYGPGAPVRLAQILGTSWTIRKWPLRDDGDRRTDMMLHNSISAH
jgi:hypothetical protein